jgi:hypothetical protein
MLPQWTVLTNYDLARIQEREAVDIGLPLATTEGVNTRLISGNLPAGLRLEGNRIVGRPFEVARTTTSSFVIRATTTEGVLDRTFKITVDGPDNPTWLTPAGRLPIGPNNVFYILDSSIIDFQLLATDTDLPAGDHLQYYIAGGDGELPPGIQLTGDGRLVGVVDPLLALDFNVINAGYDANSYSNYPFDFNVVSDSGLDSFFYDTALYDFAVPTRTPKKLNRTYEFQVTVTDNVEFAKRRFQIYVVGDDFTRADNTIMKAADGVFTADITYIRTPIWLTPSNLGIRRANNYITVYLDTLDPTNVSGKILYFLESTNNDGTPSRLPPGLSLDSDTGELAGIVPYQPAVTKEYKFTVTATRYNELQGVVTVFGTYNRDILAGNASFRIGKLPTTLVDGLNDLQNLVDQTIAIEGRNYIVESVDGSNSEYDTITLTEPLDPAGIASPLSIYKTTSGTDYFFVRSLSQNNREFYENRSLNYSSSEEYEIENIYPYTEWNISVDDSSDPIELNRSIVISSEIDFEDALEEFLSFENFPAYITTTTNDAGVVEITLILPATAQNRNSNFIKSLFHTDTSSAISVTSVGDYDRIQLDNNLTRTLNVDSQISFGVYRGGFFTKAFARGEIDQASKSKTFTIKLLGEVDSTITWLVDENLGTLNANRISTLFVKAKTTVPDALIKYNLVSGQLPPGLVLKNDGEIVGKVPINGTPEQPGLTFFDSGATVFDGSTTTLDREYNFTVLARDRFGFSAITRTFNLKISDRDNLTYSNVYVKPFLKSSQKNSFLNLINDSKIINPTLVYRPSDPNFGVQKELKALVYAGIETQNISNFVSASAKNHRRKRYFLGDVKTAVAKAEGSNDIIYEVVYIELKDPANPTSGKTKTFFKTLDNSNRITVDSIRLEEKDDLFPAQSNSPERYRPKGNTITADIDAIQTSQRSDVKKYISNIDNMRERIKATGSNSRDFLPLWMRTAQNGSLEELDYVFAIPLVYCKPGTSETIKANVLNSRFNFTLIDYDIDRYIIDATTGNSNEQFVLFANYSFNA